MMPLSTEGIDVPVPTAAAMNVPFFRPSIGEAEIAEVVNCLRSGWLTTGPTTKRFEAAFAAAVGAQARRGRQLLHGGAAPGRRSAGPRPRPGRARAHDDLRRHGRNRALSGRHADPGRLRSGDVQHGPGRCRAQARAAGAPASCRPPTARRSRSVGIIPVHVGGADDGHATRSRRLPSGTACGSSKTRPMPFRRPGGPMPSDPGSAAARTPSPSPAFRSMPTRRSPPAKAAWRSPTTRRWPIACG